MGVEDPEFWVVEMEDFRKGSQEREVCRVGSERRFVLVLHPLDESSE